MKKVIALFGSVAALVFVSTSALAQDAGVKIEEWKPSDAEKANCMGDAGCLEAIEHCGDKDCAAAMTGCFADRKTQKDAVGKLKACEAREAARTQQPKQAAPPPQPVWIRYKCDPRTPPEAGCTEGNKAGDPVTCADGYVAVPSAGGVISNLRTCVPWRQAQIDALQKEIDQLKNGPGVTPEMLEKLKGLLDALEKLPKGGNEPSPQASPDLSGIAKQIEGIRQMMARNRDSLTAIGYVWYRGVGGQAAVAGGAGVRYEHRYRVAVESRFWMTAGGFAASASNQATGPGATLAVEVGMSYEIVRRDIIQSIDWGMMFATYVSGHGAGYRGIPSAFRGYTASPYVGWMARLRPHFHGSIRCALPGVGRTDWNDSPDVYRDRFGAFQVLCTAGLGGNIDDAPPRVTYPSVRPSEAKFIPGDPVPSPAGEAKPEPKTAEPAPPPKPELPPPLAPLANPPAAEPPAAPAEPPPAAPSAPPVAPSAPPSMPDVAINGLSEAQLAEVVKKDQANIKQRCWVPAMESGGKHAKLKLSVTVDSSGSVKDAKVSGDDVAGLGTCIVNRARGWKFPPAARPSVFNVPYVFAAQ